MTGQKIHRQLVYRSQFDDDLTHRQFFLLRNSSAIVYPIAFVASITHTIQNLY